MTSEPVRFIQCPRLKAALGLAAVLGLGITLTAVGAGWTRPPIAAAQSTASDPSRFILNALLVPALDSDALPLRWVDPRPALACGPDTTVRVNGEPLVAGTLVPDRLFELEWEMDGCRPFGAHGARFEGRVKLVVVREDWGFSASVAPSGLYVAMAGSEPTLIRAGAASLPQSIDPDERVMLAAIGETGD